MVPSISGTPSPSSRPWNGTVAPPAGASSPSAVGTPDKLDLAPPSLLAPLGRLDPTIQAYISRGFLPPDFDSPLAYDDAQRKEMLSGAVRLAKYPHDRALLSRLQPGDIVLVKCPDPYVTGFTGTDWTHAGICVQVNPPVMVESVGLTSDHAGQVRVSPFSQFLGANREDATFELVRPCPDPSAPEQAADIQAAIAFARAQVGKPYDFAFAGSGKNDGTWYCSDLVWAAYDRNPASPDRPLKLDPKGRARRDAKASAALKLAGALGVSDDMMPEVSHWVKMMVMRDPVSQQVDYLLTHIIAKLPSSSPLYDVYRAPGGQAALRKLLTDALDHKLRFPDLPADGTQLVSKIAASKDQVAQAGGALGGLFGNPLAALGQIGNHLGKAFADATGGLGFAKGAAGQAMGTVGNELSPLGPQGALLLLKDGPKWLRVLQAAQAALGYIRNGAVDPNLVTPADVALGPNPARWTFSPRGDQGPPVSPPAS